MAWFGSNSEGGLMDVIRCDQDDYLVWKWHPSGSSHGANTSLKENSIRWGSSLRVKDGEVAVFVYKQQSGPIQEFIEGPFDETIKTSNFPIISNIIGLAYAGKSPFQAEVYFINLAGNIKVDFRVPYFDVFDPRFLDFPVRVAAGGSCTINITDYKAFIKLHRLINFDLEQFTEGVRDALKKYIKGIIINVPADNGMPVLQIERKLLEINAIIEPLVRKAFEADFCVNLKRFDLSSINIDKDTTEYAELRLLTADLEKKKAEVTMKNLDAVQAVTAKAANLQVETQFLTAHQVNQQTSVLKAAAENLGQMSQMNTGSGGDGLNMAGMMTGMAVGGAMGQQMAGMMGTVGQPAQQPYAAAPPPPPQCSYHVSINGQQSGPFGRSQLQEMILTNALTRQHHVWKPGMPSWELASSVAELAPLFDAAAPPPPPPPAG